LIVSLINIDLASGFKITGENKIIKTIKIYKMKKLLTLVLLFTVIAINAQEKSKNKKVTIKVSGICDMCKSRIEKAAFKTKGVKSAEWNSESQNLSLVINERKTDVLTIQKSMADIGHDTEGVQATKEAYNNLHGCCKYERTFGVENSCAKNCTKPCCKDKAKKSCCSSKAVKTSCTDKK